MSVHPQPTFVLPRPDLRIRVFSSIRGRLFFLVVFVVPRQPGLYLHQAYVPSIRDDLADDAPIVVTLGPLHLNSLVKTVSAMCCREMRPELCSNLVYGRLVKC